MPIACAVFTLITNSNFVGLFGDQGLPLPLYQGS